MSENAFITGKTKLYGVIADPISHVRAPMVFNPVFAEKGIDAVMLPFHILPQHLEETIRMLILMPNMGGVVVTIPHKMPMAELCDERDVAAEASGAVNVVRFDQGRLIGGNFDGKGFIAGLIAQGHQAAGRQVLVIGAGGAARAIVMALAESSVAGIHIANRTPEKAAEVVELVRKYHKNIPISSSSLKELDNEFEDVKARAGLIINATNLGLKPDDPFPLSLEGIENDAVVADIIMKPEMTKWLEKAKDQGLTYHKGRYMLDYQLDLIGRFIDAWD